MKKTKIAYTLFNRKSCEDSDFAYLTIEVKFGETLDSAKEYDQQPDEYHLERMTQIRSMGESTTYFRERDKGFTLKWLSSCQNHREYGAEWFALRIDDCQFSGESLKLLSKLAKLTGELGEDTGPANVLSSLHSIGARRISYADCHNSWIFTEEPTIDEIAVPWPAVETETA